MGQGEIDSTARAARRWYAVLALGSAGFTLFGSLVPFEFQGRTWDDALQAFAAAMTRRLAIESRSDGLANVMLGVPLGFALLGMLWADRSTAWQRVAANGLALLPLCAAFAASVEFAQLFVPKRTCAGSDVLAQTVGSALGMMVWLIAGQWFTGEVRKVMAGSGAASRLLIAYVLLLGFIEALPLDLTLSPANLYHKLRDGRVRVVPFSEFGSPGGSRAWDRIGSLAKLSGLYLPAGLIAGCLPGRFWATRNPMGVLAAAVALPLAIEAGQLLVESRNSSATDSIVGTAALMIGWRLAKQPLTDTSRGLIAAGWFVLLAIASWQPFDFPGPAQAFDWVPGMPLEGGNPLSALEEMLTKLVLFGLVGAIVAATRFRQGLETLFVAAGIGAGVSAVFEAGQLFTPNHTPCITDVLLGGMGAAAGSWLNSLFLNTKGSDLRTQPYTLEG